MKPDLKFSPAEHAHMIVDYVIGNCVDEEYLPQRKWGVHLIEAAMIIMIDNGISSTKACGKEYSLEDLAEIDRKLQLPLIRK